MKYKSTGSPRRVSLPTPTPIKCKWVLGHKFETFMIFFIYWGYALWERLISLIYLISATSILMEMEWFSLFAFSLFTKWARKVEKFCSCKLFFISAKRIDGFKCLDVCALLINYRIVSIAVFVAVVVFRRRASPVIAWSTKMTLFTENQIICSPVPRGWSTRFWIFGALFISNWKIQ